MLDIRFIYFDLGKVLVEFDPAVAVRQVASVLACDPAIVQSVMYDSGLELRLEGGAINENEFLDTLFREIGSSAPGSDVLNAMSAMFSVKTTMIPVVSRVAETGIPTGILSNTCRPHWDWIERQRYQIVRTLSSVTALSYEIGSLKPERNIYDAAAELCGTRPEEILFIDDRSENVSGAIDAGWHAIHYTSTVDLIRQLRSNGFDCFT